jgi:hypothetical protein
MARHVAEVKGRKLLVRVVLALLVLGFLVWWIPAVGAGFAEHRACKASGGTVVASGACVKVVETESP